MWAALISLVMRFRVWLCASVWVTACGDSGRSSASDASFSGSASATTGGTSATGEVPTGSGEATAATGTLSATGTGSDTGFKYDLGAPDDSEGSTGPAPPLCKVDGEDAPVPCVEKAPPDSFAAEVQWAWEDDLQPGNRCGLTPLVANFTDDNGDGEIDLCDTPDILTVVSDGPGSGHLILFDGATGTVHWRNAEFVSWATTPAVGDFDGDGVVEFVASDPVGTVMAYENDGTIKWTSMAAKVPYGAAMGLADLDADGDVEIYGGRLILDHTGALLHTLDDEEWLYPATAAADLDGDGDLEVVLGSRAFHHDGTMYYDNPEVGLGYPQIADLDADGLPEVLVTGSNGFSILEHDGASKPGALGLQPTGDSAGELFWRRPATIHDFDGDGLPEFAQSSAQHYSVFEPNPVSIVWSADVLDGSGIAAGTAFDFLGDGIAEAMYADETTFFAFDGAGSPLMTAPRLSGTMIEYPTVADVDNDGAAEVVVVSYSTMEPSTGYPCIQVLRDAEERWVGARRIYNQHTYHVTNVREDGSIPQQEPRHWEQLNTFRTQAQLEGGSACKPPPPG